MSGRNSLQLLELTCNSVWVYGWLINWSETLLPLLLLGLWGGWDRRSWYYSGTDEGSGAGICSGCELLEAVGKADWKQQGRTDSNSLLYYWPSQCESCVSAARGIPELMECLETWRWKSRGSPSEATNQTGSGWWVIIASSHEANWLFNAWKNISSTVFSTQPVSATTGRNIHCGYEICLSPCLHASSQHAYSIWEFSGIIVERERWAAESGN